MHAIKAIWGPNEFRPYSVIHSANRTDVGLHLVRDHGADRQAIETRAAEMVRNAAKRGLAASDAVERLRTLIAQRVRALDELRARETHLAKLQGERSEALENSHILELATRIGWLSNEVRRREGELPMVRAGIEAIDREVDKAQREARVAIGQAVELARISAFAAIERDTNAVMDRLADLLAESGLLDELAQLRAVHAEVNTLGSVRDSLGRIGQVILDGVMEGHEPDPASEPAEVAGGCGLIPIISGPETADEPVAIAS